MEAPQNDRLDDLEVTRPKLLPIARTSVDPSGKGARRNAKPDRTANGTPLEKIPPRRHLAVVPRREVAITCA
eukprot:14158380-Alexandrium_andersonii.AAC.1